MNRCLPALLLALCAPAAAEPAPEPVATQRVAEDDHVRIEELKVRGQTRRIVVQPKTKDVKPYQILPADGDTAPESAGKRVWQILSF